MAEATQDAAKPARKKNAHYDVFAQDATSGEWMQLGQPPQLEAGFAAASRREAIAKATRGMDDDAAYGTFATVRHGEFKVLTRAKKTIVADDWGAV